MLHIVSCDASRCLLFVDFFPEERRSILHKVGVITVSWLTKRTSHWY